jgi:RNA polymerase primary sigma factor
MVEVLTRWKRAHATLAQKLGREPSTDEIGKYLKLTPSKIAIIRQALSASAPVGRAGSEDSNFDLEDILAGVPSREETQALPGDVDREALRNAMEYALTERERHILELRYGLISADSGEENEPNTLERIGEKIGLTRERVRQIENQALRKLQLFLKNKDEREEREREQRRKDRAEAERQGRPMPLPKQSVPAPQRRKTSIRVKPQPKSEAEAPSAPEPDDEAAQ